MITIRFRLLWSVPLLLLTAAVCTSGCKRNLTYGGVPPKTKVENLNEGLKPGAERVEVRRFLESEGMVIVEDNPQLLAARMESDHVRSSILRPVIVVGTIRVVARFNRDGRLVKGSAQQVLTGP